MTDVRDLYLNVIKAGIAAHPRSLQKRIGPSEIGDPCDRAILHKLNGNEEPERGLPWKPAIGTAMHSQLDTWFTTANFGGGDVTSLEWVTEWEVTVGTIGGVDITGHSDLFHVPTGTVIDHKVIGPRQLDKYRLHGPSTVYRIQAHLYGLGFTRDGGWGPARHVAIAFLPRDGELSGMHFWSEPFDPHIALEAMHRLNRLWVLLDTVGLDRALTTTTVCDEQWCMWCREERRAIRNAARTNLFGDDFPEAATEPVPLRGIPATPQPAALAPITHLFT